MIYFRSDIGRIGNQLFILAFALHLKNAFNVKSILSDRSFLKYFHCGKSPLVYWLLSQYFFRIKARVSKILVSKYLSLTKVHIEAASHLSRGNHKTIGYFQSPQYFEESKNHIITQLGIQKKYKKRFRENFGHLFQYNHVTIIHARQTDYKDHKIPFLGEASVLLPLEYYKTAIEQLRTKATQFVLVGDDENYLKNSFNFLQNPIIAHSIEIMDFQILMNANACILSNSTFAWWGAYLNTRAEQIIAPRYFLGYNAKKEFPICIYPNGWHQLHHEEA